ncbi:MAG: DUF4169 family protein [Pseudomonadota bacterium]
MTTPINLNKARKARAKAAKQQNATENRVKFGRTKAEKAAERQKETKSKSALDGKKLNSD